MTRIALALGASVTTVVVALLTLRLHRAQGRRFAVDWIGWGIAVTAAYIGLALVAWWALDRDARRRVQK